MTERIDEEILSRVEELDKKKILFLGDDEIGDLVGCLSFDKAKQFLGSNADETMWKTRPRDRDSILERMLDYMSFAWEKANDERGLSAIRSMEHYQAWIWLIGDDMGDLCEYDDYGKNNLIKICKKYGWDYEEWG